MWGYYEKESFLDCDTYAVMKKKYQTKPDFVPKEYWFINDNVKMSILSKTTHAGSAMRLLGIYPVLGYEWRILKNHAEYCNLM